MRTGPQRIAVPILTATAGVLGAVLALLTLAPDATASETLQNGGFESWSGASPNAWVVSGGTFEPSSEVAIDGQSLHVTSNGTAMIQQNVAAEAGAPFFGSVYAASGGGAASVTLSVVFLDQGYLAIGISNWESTVLVTQSSFVPLTVSGSAPPGTAWARFKVTMAGSAAPLSAYLDAASFDQGVAPPPTPTDVPTDTPAATPAATDTQPGATATAGGAVTATRTVRPTATEQPGKTATATKTATPTRTATATKTVKATSTAKPSKTATATRTAKPTSADATRTPTPAATATPQAGPDSGSGGLLADGDFEQASGSVPAGWSKFGGTMALTADAYDGDLAAALTSTTTSTKWLYQAVPVDGGSWYVAGVIARVDGEGEASLRLSWYSSGDGSGSALDDVDGDATTSADWTELSTGAVEAPDAARSVRVRLMLRPESSAEVTAIFDDATLFETDAPPAPSPTPGDDGHDGTTPATPVPARPPDANGTAAPRGATAGAGGTTAPKATASKLGRTRTPSGTATSSPKGGSTLRFSELLTSSGGTEELQWVELVNPGTAAVSTEGWSIATKSSTIELAAAKVSSGGYAVVGANAGALPAGVLVVPLANASAVLRLDEAGDELHLFSPDGTELDAVSYGDDAAVFAPAPLAPGAAQSLGLLDPAADHDGVDWTATDHPTPGERNAFAAAVAGAGAVGRGIVTERKRSTGPSATVVWAALGTLLVVGLGGTAAYSQRRRLDALSRKVRRDG